MTKAKAKAAAAAPDPASGATIPGSTSDSFANFAAKLGIGTGNQSDSSGYNFNFITRNRIGLEAAYRGSWVIGAAIDYPAEDMTSSGVILDSNKLKPDEIDDMTAAMRDLGVWGGISDTIKWSRLYGGALGVLLIDGQDMSTPLKLDTIKEGQFRGIYAMDRWMVNPDMSNMVRELGASFGMPERYEVVAAPQDGTVIALPVKGRKQAGAHIHHSRCIRMEGLRLPYQQRLVENMWGASVIERIFDRVTAFDSVSTGAAQLVYRAYIRILKIKDLRSVVASGGKALEGVVAMTAFMARMQSIEGISMVDLEDEFEALTYTFSGLDSVMLQFGQQLCGALEIPMTRMFGESPAGLNATGESDMQTYADNVNKRQEAMLRAPLTKVLDVVSRSVRGKPLDPGFTFSFAPIRQPTPAERATIADTRTKAVVGAFDSGVVDRPTAMKELKQGSDTDGMWSNITDEAIKDAENDPTPGELAEHAMEPPEPKVIAGPGAKPAEAA